MNNKDRQNCIFLDTKENDSLELANEIRRSSGIDWKIKSWNNAGLEKGRFGHIRRVLLYFIHGTSIFVRRRQFNRIIAWQQFYGIIFAFLCSIFHVKKQNVLYVFTFIYKEKKGVAGRLFYRFVSRAVSSKYVDKIFVYSPSEVSFYHSIFPVHDDRFTFVPLGYTSPLLSGNIPYDGDYPFFLAAGRSNRDYDFLLEVAKHTNAQIVIICDCLAKHEEDLPANVHLYRNIWGENYCRFLDKCKAVLIPLDNPNISSGQLVMIQAMQYRKPVIATAGKALEGYLKDGVNALVAEKTIESFVGKMNSILEDENLYQSISNKGYEEYLHMYSCASFGRRLSELF